MMNTRRIQRYHIVVLVLDMKKQPIHWVWIVLCNVVQLLRLYSVWNVIIEWIYCDKIFVTVHLTLMYELMHMFGLNRFSHIEESHPHTSSSYVLRDYLLHSICERLIDAISNRYIFSALHDYEEKCLCTQLIENYATKCRN